MSINDRTERLVKLDEVMQKLKIIYKQGTAQDGNMMKVCSTFDTFFQSFYGRDHFAYNKLNAFISFKS